MASLRGLEIQRRQAAEGRRTFLVEVAMFTRAAKRKSRAHAAVSFVLVCFVCCKRCVRSQRMEYLFQKSLFVVFTRVSGVSASGVSA